MKHIMIDLETMGNGPTAAIVSIGAVEFDPETQKLGRSFYHVVDLQSSIDAGLTVDGSTVMWWLQQNEAARKALSDNPLSLLTVLNEFTKWIDTHASIWSHGASFDLPILKNAFTHFHQPPPWKFRNELDTRTVLFMTGQKMPSNLQGVSHNALDDAKNQAVAIMRFLKESKK